MVYVIVWLSVENRLHYSIYCADQRASSSESPCLDILTNMPSDDRYQQVSREHLAAVHQNVGRSSRNPSYTGRSSSLSRNADVHRYHQETLANNRKPNVKPTSTGGETYDEFRSTDGLCEQYVGCRYVRGGPRNRADTDRNYSLNTNLEALAIKSNDGLDPTKRSTVGPKPSTYAEDVRRQVTNRGYAPRLVTGSATSDMSAPSTLVGESYDANKYG